MKAKKRILSKRILSVAATIALLAAASPAFAQVYVGGGSATVEVNLEALNALPQTGPSKAKAVRLTHPKALRQANHQVIQYDAELETTYVGGNGEPLAQLSALKHFSGHTAHTTSSALAATRPLEPGVTLAALRPDEDQHTSRRHSHRRHRHVSATKCTPSGDSLSLIDGNPA